MMVIRRTPGMLPSLSHWKALNDMCFFNDRWFELVDMMHKLILTSILPFFPAGVQMPLGMGVVFGYAILILITQPYFRKSDDRLHLCAQTEIFLLMMAGFIFYNGDALDLASDAVLSIFLIIVIAVFVGLFFTQTANLLVKKCLSRLPCCSPVVAWVQRRRVKHKAAKAALEDQRKLHFSLSLSLSFSYIPNKRLSPIICCQW
jgi:hypothetical protein